MAQTSELNQAVKKAPKSQREGLEFLIKYMPQGDKDTLKASFLLEELNYAYRARKVLPWCAALPDSIFMNDVLPYASMNETREPWRKMFWDMFYPLVKDIKDVRVAIDTINKAVKDMVKVEYNTKRKKPHQSPRESMAIGMASCSGLSIILTDVFRTMGIPSRIAGTPLWVTKEGNHNWSEVFIDGKWYFTEYYPNAALNKSWFLERAGKADKSNPIYWMYATSWKPQSELYFPMVWAHGDKTVPGIDVTDFYIDLYNAEKAQSQQGVATAIKMYLTEQGTRGSADRVACDVRIHKGDTGDILFVGTTKGATADMNDYLTFYLPENQSYSVEYIAKDGTKVHQKFTTTTQPQQVELFFDYKK